MRLVCLVLLGGTSCIQIRNGERKTSDAEPHSAIANVLGAFAEDLNVKKITVGGHGCHVGEHRTIERDELAIWQGLCAIDSVKLQRLFAYLVATRTGSFASYDAKLGDKPIAVAIAASLGITDQDVGFNKQDLEGLRRPALERITRANGDHETKDLTAAKLREILPSLRARDYVVPSLRFGTENQLTAAWNGLPIPDADQPEEDDYFEDEAEGDESDADEPTFDEDEIDKEAAQ